MFDPLSFVRPGIRAMEGYTPGEQVKDCIKLNTNEPAWPASPSVQAALEHYAAGTLRVYPSPRADALRAKAAEVFGVTPDMVLAGNGSDDVLTVLVRGFVDAGESIAVPYPTYGLYDTLASLQGARMIHVPYGDDWSLPEELGTVGAKLVFVSSPNNPSATLASREAILRLVERRNCIVVVDEAYTDFSGRSFIPDIAAHGNLIVIRTFSKSYALAGARLGLLFAQAPIVAELMKVKDSYNVNAITQALGLAALEDQAYVKELVAKTLTERAFLEKELASFGFRWPKSDANFLLVDVGSRERAKALYLGLKERGILVRYWDRPRLGDSIRITVGTHEQNERLVAGIREIVG
ncbi:MAG: histidinol-phosphate transaminase [Polyangiales bacterium]